MNTKRIISLVASLALVLSLSVGLTGCGDKAAQDDNQGSTDGEGTKYTVGICQLVQHEALDAATQGFIDALNEALPGQVEFQNKNASGDNANCSTIVNGFVSDGVDLIMANATGALTAAAAATSDIPILGTSITAYGVALDIDDFNGTVGGGVIGGDVDNVGVVGSGLRDGSDVVGVGKGKFLRFNALVGEALGDLSDLVAGVGLGGAE